MKKYLLVVIYLLQPLLMLAQTSFKIEGKIDAEFSQKIKISYLEKADSVITNDGYFSFTGELEHPVLLKISSTNVMNNKTISQDIFVEKGLVKLYTTFSKLGFTHPILEHDFSQSILTKYNNRFGVLVDMYRFAMDSLVKRPNVPEDFKKAGQSLAKKIYSFEELYDKDFIVQNTFNYVGAYFFYRYGANYMNEREIDSVYNLFPLSFRNSFYLTHVEEKIKYKKQLKEGQVFIKTGLKSLTHDNFYINSLFTSKLTLIDLWATWCKPCIESHETLKDLYKKYKNKGLEIIGISIDDNQENWRKYLDREKLSWINFIDPKGIKGQINKIFSLESDNGIPFFVFINEKGEYLKIDVEKDQLETFIKGYLNI